MLNVGQIESTIRNFKYNVEKLNQKTLLVKAKNNGKSIYEELVKVFKNTATRIVEKKETIGSVNGILVVDDVTIIIVNV